MQILSVVMAEKDGGYDLNFIEEPPDELLCLICTFPARDPLQNDCCGKVFCTTCITKYREEKEECPNCRDTQGNHFKDKRSKFVFVVVVLMITK